MVDLNFKIQDFFYFSISFLFFTVIGTLSHEYGHILVAKNYGYKTYLHYGSMHYDKKSEVRNIDLYYTANEEKIKKESIENESFLKMLSDKNKKAFWITVGGPVQTILTGFLGLLILYFRKNRNIFKWIDWLAVFLALFWLREVFNLVTGSIQGLFFNKNYFGGDEYHLSNYLELPSGTLSIILGFLGLSISLFVIFKIIPKPKRFTFILSGLVGGLSGFYLWYQIIGPTVLP